MPLWFKLIKNMKTIKTFCYSTFIFIICLGILKEVQNWDRFVIKVVKWLVGIDSEKNKIILTVVWTYNTESLKR